MEYILGISDASLRRAAALDAIRASLSGAGGLGGILLFFIEKAAASQDTGRAPQTPPTR